MIARSEFQEHPWENFAWLLKGPAQLDVESWLGEFVRRLCDTGERGARRYLDHSACTRSRGGQFYRGFPLPKQCQFIQGTDCPRAPLQKLVQQPIAGWHHATVDCFHGGMIVTRNRVERGGIVVIDQNEIRRWR